MDGSVINSLFKTKQKNPQKPYLSALDTRKLWDIALLSSHVGLDFGAVLTLKLLSQGQIC